MNTKNLFQLAFLSLQLIIITNLTSAQPGTLDSSFGINGKVTSPAGGTGSSVAIQQDGKIVVVGTSSSNPSNFKIVRYNTTGTIDSTFGDNGIVITDFEGTNDFCEALTIQEDGKILAAGRTGDGLGYAVASARFNIDGSPDSSFGENGKAPGGGVGVNGGIYSVAIQQDKKIIVGGSYANYNYEYKLALFRYNSDGTFDSTFGYSGGVYTYFPYSDPECTDILILPDGNIIAAGHSSYGSSGFFARYKTNGILDSTFGYNGKVAIREYVNSAALQPDGKIIIAGFGPGYALARYTINGIPDSTFDDDGKVTTDLEDYNEFYSPITIQPDGKIIAAGYVYSDNFNANFALRRYESNGKVDSNFQNGSTDFGGSDHPSSVALQNDGKIVVAGYSYNLESFFAVAMYNNDAVLPVTLLNFSAIKKMQTVLLSWQTASEQNNDYFLVERSNNGNIFFKTGKIKTKGNSSQVQMYSYIDYTPLKEINYYRLKQVDKDGKFSYSPIVDVYFSNDAGLLIFPNPSKGNITVTYNSAVRGEIQLNIFNITGKKLFTKTVQAIVGNNIFQLNVENLTPGIYNLQLKNNTEPKQVRFMIEQ